MCVRSKLECGSILLDSANKSVIEILSPISNTGARIALGAFCISPADQILKEVGLPTLGSRIMMAMLIYACKVSSDNRNPVHRIHPTSFTEIS